MRQIINLAIVSILVLVTQISFGNSTDAFTAEYLKLKNELYRHQQKIRDDVNRIRTEQKQAVTTSKNEAKRLQDGLVRVQRYARIIVSRYVNKDGEYLPGLEVTKKDFENINAIFETYLAMTPFKQSTSAGHAHRTLKWGAKEIERRVKEYADPNERNNADLEILALKYKDAAREQRIVDKIAKRLGVDLEGARKVASDE